MEAQSINIGYGNFKAAGAAYNLVPDSAMLMSRTGSLDLKAVGELNVPWVFEHGLSRGFGEQWTRILLGQLAEYMYDLRVKPPDKSCQSVGRLPACGSPTKIVYFRIRHRPSRFLSFSPFPETRRDDELERNEAQALIAPSPTQSPSKDPVQTAVTSSPEQSPKKRKSRFQLSQLASLNNLLFRNTAQPSPTGTETTNSLFPNQSKNIISCKKWQKHMINL
ncbi:hypothetical protein PCH_Pc21g13650 [Penicillium rubens Wisconsin 54-1255]|uniref:Uncharacterized protein n=1 Tax=Penicillium rubens (strain ATCC 28089 / DSM 1075 / NRRL 1951 / Wisconsin 54-1255) TaxID=500485 RepID=B6HNB5_PENRW|nr:hypothetical protein PCH_Pc21g13650 [Penicillium rubens Wisconsin 54-1255]